MLIVGNELIKLNTVFPLLREKVENQYDYIVYCFGGIETKKFFAFILKKMITLYIASAREIQKGGSISVIEKGIDVWFALEAYELLVLIV